MGEVVEMWWGAGMGKGSGGGGRDLGQEEGRRSSDYSPERREIGLWVRGWRCGNGWGWGYRVDDGGVAVEGSQDEEMDDVRAII